LRNSPSLNFKINRLGTTNLSPVLFVGLICYMPSAYFNAIFLTVLPDVVREWYVSAGCGSVTNNRLIIHYYLLKEIKHLSQIIYIIISFS
jgi:hypothetical protein